MREGGEEVGVGEGRMGVTEMELTERTKVT